MRSLFLYSFFATVLALCALLLIAEPIWNTFSPPFEIPRTQPRIFAPVDGPFYIKNAIEGYQWERNSFLSLWFHPLLSIFVAYIPLPISAEIKFWLLSLFFSMGSLMLTYILLQHVVGYDIRQNLSPSLLIFIPLLPGGLGIATGNPEIPTLFFCLCLLLSVISWKYIVAAFLFGILAILTKPNALYMVPILFVYLVSASKEKDFQVIKCCLSGIAGIILGWLGWIIFVGINVGQLNIYWELRELSSEFVAGSLPEYFEYLVDSFLYQTDLRDQVRYSSALIFPIVSIWLLGTARFSSEVHRLALATGYLAVIAIFLYMGNPNKIIVYITTLPGHFVAYIAFIATVSQKYESSWDRIKKTFMLITLVLYCIFVNVFYIVGTPLAWYY